MSTDEIKKACLGKSKSGGGLNLPEIKKIAAQNSINVQGLKRDQILELLCRKLGLPTKANPQAAKPAAKMPAAKPAAIKPVKPPTKKPAAVVKPAVIQAPKHTIAQIKNLCDKATFHLHDDYFQHVSGDGKNVYYKGKKVHTTKGNKIGSGTYGSIYKLTIHTVDGDFVCAYKVINPGKGQAYNLEELRIIRSHANALTCDGVLSIVNMEWKGVLMPLANGGLDNLETHVTFNQALEIGYRIGLQLKCLRDRGYQYYDVKPANCVYFCRKDGEIDIALADLGSIIPDSDGDYTSSFTAPRYYQGFVSGNISKDYADRYTTHLIINLILAMFTGSGIGLWCRNRATYMTAWSRDITTMIAILKSKGIVSPHPLVELLGYMKADMDITRVPPVDEFLPLIPALTIGPKYYLA